MYQNNDNAPQIIERDFISSNESLNNNFLFNLLRVAMNCMESTWKYLAPELEVNLPSASGIEEDTLFQSNTKDNLKDNYFCSNEAVSTSKNEFQITSAITLYALKKMGENVSLNDVISTEKIKKIRRNSLLRTHPDKSSQDSVAFIQHQNAYTLLLNEEYDFKETEQEKNVRRYTLFESTILPDLKNQQSELKSKFEKVSMAFDDKNTKIQEQIATLKNEFLFNKS